MSAKNAIKNRWCIIKGQSQEGNIQYQVSNDVIGMRTVWYPYDTFEDAKIRLEEIKLSHKNKKFIDNKK